MFPFQLIRGNPDNLEGRVMIFCPFGTPISKDEELLYKVIYGSLTGEDTISRARQFGCTVPDSIFFQEKLPFYSLHWNASPIGKIIDASNEDLIELPHFREEKWCIGALTHSILLYYHFYNDQRQAILPAPATKDVEKNSNLSDFPNRQLSYKNFKPEQVKDYLRSSYAQPLIDAIAGNDPKRAEELRQGMAFFSYGSVFARDIPLVIAIIDSGVQSLENPLLTAYLEKIHSLSIQEFSRTAEAQRRIDSLLGQSKTSS